MKYVLYFAVLFFLLVVETGILAPVGILYGNLALILVVICSILLSKKETIVIAILAGIMLDFASGAKTGSYVLCYLGVYGFTNFFVNKLVTREQTRVTLLLCVALNTIVFAICFIAVNRILFLVNIETFVDWRFLIGKKLLLDIVVNIILTYPIYYLFVGMNRVQKKLSAI